MKKPLVKVEFSETSAENSKSKSRRKFIKLSGLGIAGSSFLLYGCSEDDLFDPGAPVGGPDPVDPPTTPPPPPPPTGVFDLGAGNLGILNYAYALEQLEAAFYTEVVEGGYFAGANDEEKQILEDVWYHEVIHRDFFKVAITAAVGEGNEDMVLPDLEFDFSGVDFDSRDSVLGTSLVLEDTGVSAYNGAGNLIDVTTELGPVYLLLAGKIVSVEARHASAFADLIEPDTDAFARDEILVSIDGFGPAFDKATPPAEVIDAVVATGFVVTEFTANELPMDQ